ncbi:MAG TPA: S9 family peptidase [Thermoanaerobaculia bacterium]|nr:S9 family peptidase [Thermoanaerobaculia bacterium]
MLRFAAVAFLVFSTAASAKRPMTPEDLWAMERAGAPALSPDGKQVVFTINRISVEENKGDSDLWLVPADGCAPPRRLTWNPGADGGPAWSPDGQRLAFVSKRGEAPPQLYVMTLDGGEAQPVTKLPVAVQGPKWFPDGKRIGFVASTWPDLNGDWPAVQKRLDENKADKIQAKIADTRLLRFWDEYRTDGRFHHVFSVDLATSEVKDLTPGLARTMDFLSPEEGWDLSPEGDEIAYGVNNTEPPYHTINFDVFIQKIGSEPRNVTEDNPAHDMVPRYSPDGRWIVYGRNRRPDIDPDFGRLARYDRRSGETRILAEDWDTQADSWTFTPDGKTLVFHAQEKGRVHIYSLPVEGGAPKLLAKGGTTGGVDVAGGRIVFTRQSLLAPANVFVSDLAGGEPRSLTTLNAERLAEIDFGTVGEATFEGAGGDPVHMHLVFPPGFDPKRKWPLVHMIHGGPHGASLDDFHYRWNGALFASRGYVVSMVNFHGSTGYGQAFAESILGNHADKPFEDMMKATDWLIAQGYVDEKRMAAAGGSYGGYLVAWLLGHTNRFAALVNHAGVYDLMGQFASDDAYGRPNNYGSAPWIDPARIDLYSPSRYAKNFKTPTLILHGEKDYRVPVTQGINLYGVLQGKGVPARIVIFPDENHWVLKPQSALLWWKEVFGWLGKYLGE